MATSFDVHDLDVERLLETWRWLVPEPAALVARNAFGDLFLRTGDGKIVWLDVGGGERSEVTASEIEFYESLQDSDKRLVWMAEADFETAKSKGLVPNDNLCIGFKTPIVFAESGSIPNNPYLAELYDHIAFLGDLHRQIRDVPDGAKVRLRIDREG
jgi:hypothetical protein